MARHAPSWLIASVRFTVLALVALALLLGTAWLLAVALAMVYGGPVATRGHVAVGMICSLITWLFVAAFHLRKTTLTVPAPDGDRFLQSARLLLAEMGYEIKSRRPYELSTRPRFHALLLGGGVHVKVIASLGRLVGPKVCVEILRNRLRVQAHLNLVQQSLREHRHTETLIKRAELQMRVKPHDLDAVRINVIEVLQASADVVCDVHLLVQSEAGIPESVLEFQVSQWLAQQGIEATLHKHFIQLHRPLSNGEIALEDAV